MSEISRYNGNYQAFGINATAGERTVFNDQATESDTLDDNITSDYLRGLGINVTGSKPIKESIAGALFVPAQTLAYLHQKGVAEWNNSQEYFNGSHCVGSDHQLYRSVSSPNTGNDPTTDDGSNWVNDLEEANAYTDTEVAAEAATRASADSSEASTRAAADSAHAALTDAHGATASPTGSTIPLRDAEGRFSVGNANADNHVMALGQMVFATGTGNSGRIGFQKRISGVVREVCLQWKEISLPNNATVAHTFEYSFATSAHAVWVCRSSNFDSYDEESGVAAYNYTTTGCTVSSQMATNGIVFAIGYRSI